MDENAETRMFIAAIVLAGMYAGRQLGEVCRREESVPLAVDAADELIAELQKPKVPF